MLNDGVNVCLSLDANSLAPVNMFEALRLAWSLGIPWQGDETAALKPVSFRQALQMATINGAHALGLGVVTGSISVGKRADVLLVRRDDLNMAPAGDIEAALVTSANTQNLDTVIIDGRVMKRDGRIAGLDIAAIKRDAAESAAAIRRRQAKLATSAADPVSDPLRA